MTLPSGAHVQIGPHEFLLDEEPEQIRRQDPHYVHRYESLQAQHFDISGMPDKASIRQEKLLWAFDDWSGGEGNRQYYPDDPTVYDRSDGLNGRIRGQLTGRPNRVKATVTAGTFTPTNVQDRPTICAAGGSLWLVGSRQIWESTDGGLTWTARTSGVSAGRITAAAGGFDVLYYAAWSTAASGTRQLKYMAPGGTGGNVLAAADPTAVKGFMGLAWLDGSLYGWTGKELWEFRVYAGPPLATNAYKKLYDKGRDLTPDLGATIWWADIVAGENNVVFFVSTAGQSQVWELRAGVPRPLWRPPYGFTIKSITVELNIIWAAGHWGGSSNTAGRGALMAFPQDTMRPEFVGWFRKQQNLNLQMQEMANSYGSQILIAGGWTARIFVYDGDTDAISMLDDLYSDTADGGNFLDNDDKIGAVYTFGLNRLAVRYSPVNSRGRTQYAVYTWADDEPPNRETNTSQILYSGEWDIGFPMEIKALIGFYVTYQPMVANQSIQVEYQLDGGGVAGTWLNAGTVNVGTDGNLQGRVFIQVSDDSNTRKFYRLRWRITLAGTSGLQPPILYSATAESSLISYEESWELEVRLKDELNRTRPSHRKRYAETVRGWLLATIQNKNLVLFKDGYKYRTPGQFDQYVVVIEEPTDVISLAGEGVMRIRLRRVPS